MSTSRKLIAAGAGVAAIGAALLFVPNLILNQATIDDFPSEVALASPAPEVDAGNNAVIELASHQVPVREDGLFDRFRSNPPLSVVRDEQPTLDVSWFETMEKERKDVGFTTYSPNFYYRNSSISAIYTADMSRIEELLPADVRDVVQPISFTSGKGLIAITSYAYHYCDNDTYNELSISIVTTKPNQSNWGLISLLGELSDKSLWGYVLKLPVDTELARVRGVVGYNLPKWLIPIGYNPEGDNVEFTYYDEQGKLDFSMTGRKLDVEGSDPEITRLNFVNLDANGQLTHGYSDVRAVKRASSRDAIDIRLGLSDGPLSTYIRSLGLERLVRYDYQPEFQAALYTPEVIQ
ncbi:conserved hypothetical protein [Ruegeria sp. TrichCH4B]|nr:conserved hypothetical protein [Ruegeria sp. TrichCH4B]